MADEKKISEEYVVKFSADIGDLDKNLDTANNKVDETVSRLSTASKAWNDYRARISDTFARAKESMKPFTEGLKNDFKNMTSGLSGMGKNLSVSPDSSEFEKVSDAMTEATQKTNVFKSLWDKMTAHEGTFSDEAEKIREKIAGIKSEMEKLSQTKVQTDDYKWVTSEIDKASEKLADYLAKQDKMDSLGVKHNSSSWKSLQYDIEQTKFRLDDLIATRSAFEQDGEAYTSGADTAKYADYASQLAGLESKLAEVESTGTTVAASIGQKLKAGISTGVKTGVSIAKAGLSGMGKAAKGAVNHFKGLRKETTSLNDVLKKVHRTFTSFRRMLMMRIKRTFISSIFNDMQSDIGSVAEMSDRFNSSISGMISSCKNLGMQMVAGVEPLVSVAGPYVQAFIDKLTEGADKLSQFAARVTGNDTYLKSTKGNYDYAKSLDKTTSSTKKATKAAKEYQNTVLGFDQLNKLNGRTDGDADSSTADGKPQLQKVQTEASKINSIADRIYNSLRNGKFKSAGKAFGEAINEGFSWLKNVAGWDNNAKKFTKTIKNVIDFINGVSSGFRGDVAGEAIGDVVNTLIESLKLLTDPSSGVDFKAIGANVGTTIKSTFDKIKWTDAGAVFVQGIQGMLRYIYGIISVPGFWSSLGFAVKNGIGGAIGALVPEDWSNTLITFVNGIAQFLQTAFSDKVKFAELGHKLAEMINQTFSGISGADVAAGISAFLSAITTTINEMLGDISWGEIMKTLGDILVNLDWLSLIELVGLFAIPKIPGIITPMLGGALSTLFSSLGSLALAHPWALVIAGIATIVVGAIVNHWDEIKEWASGAWESIKGWAGRVADTIGENVDAAWEAVGAIPGKLADLGVTLWDSITGWFTDLFDFVGGVIGDIVDGITSIPGKIAGAAKSIGDWFSGIGDTVSGWFGGRSAGNHVGGVSLYSIPRMAGGGIAGDGQVFIANESGPELVGSHGGKSVVMNNNQIVTAVSSGVRDAVADVMMAFTDRDDNGGGDGDIVLYIDSEELARASLRGKKKLDKRSNPSVSFA